VFLVFWVVRALYREHSQNWMRTNLELGLGRLLVDYELKMADCFSN